MHVGKVNVVEPQAVESAQGGLDIGPITFNTRRQLRRLAVSSATFLQSIGAEIMSASSPSRMSKIVELWLESQGQRYSLSEVGPDFVVLRKSATIPSGPATVVIDIEGQIEQCLVQVLPIWGAQSLEIPIGRT